MAVDACQCHDIETIYGRLALSDFMAPHQDGVGKACFCFTRFLSGSHCQTHFILQESLSNFWFHPDLEKAPQEIGRLLFCLPTPVHSLATKRNVHKY